MISDEAVREILSLTAHHDDREFLSNGAGNPFFDHWEGHDTDVGSTDELAQQIREIIERDLTCDVDVEVSGVPYTEFSKAVERLNAGQSITTLDV